MRLPNPELRERILNEARAMDLKEMNMRSIASACDIALGTLYNYFSSKEDIIMTLTEEYWEQKLTAMKIDNKEYQEALRKLYDTLSSAYADKGQMLMYALRNRGEESRKRMGNMQIRLEEVVKEILPIDKRILAEFVTDNIISAIERRKQDIEILLSLI